MPRIKSSQSPGPIQSPESEPPDTVGLCSTCRHALLQRNARGSSFTRCGLAETDARLLRYPPLPVRECCGFAAAD